MKCTRWRTLVIQRCWLVLGMSHLPGPQSRTTKENSFLTVNVLMPKIAREATQVEKTGSGSCSRKLLCTWSLLLLVCREHLPIYPGLHLWRVLERLNMRKVVSERWRVDSFGMYQVKQLPKKGELVLRWAQKKCSQSLTQRGELVLR
jgi:hypothetical protein